MSVYTHQKKLQEILESDGYDKRFLEILNKYLDKENRNYLKFAKHKRYDEDEYINPYPTINIKPHLSGLLVNGETATIRLDETSTFDKIKLLTFYLWNLDQRLF